MGKHRQRGDGRSGPRRPNCSLYGAGGVVLAVLTVANVSSGADLIAHFRLDGIITEHQENIFSLLGMSEVGPPRTMKRWLELIDQAGRDKRVVAVYLTIDNPMLTLPQAQALQRALKGLPASKPVYVHADSYTLGAYLVACGGSYIAMTPTGQVALKGVAVRYLHFKNLLDKIGVRADMMQVGAYKGAIEPFVSATPSKQTEEQTGWLLDSMIGQIVRAVASRKGIDADQAQALIEEGVVCEERAKEAGLVDRLAYRNEFTQEVRRRHGMAKVAVNYGQKLRPEIDMSNPFELLMMFGKAFSRAAGPEKSTIGLIYLDGLIATGVSSQGLLGLPVAGSETLRRALKTATDSPAIKAVVLRVNSPGGDALGSDVVYHSVREAAARKPVVVSMADYAASGGYYVAAGAKYIFAEPGTITGSIGVAGGKISIAGLGGLLGITSFAYKRGRNADLEDPFQPFTDAQRAMVRQLMQRTYEDFVKAVKTGRAERIKDIDAVTAGRVFTGEQAVKNGLVDQIGGLDEALRYAARQAGVQEYEVKVIPRPKTFIEALMQGFGMIPPEQEQVRSWVPSSMMVLLEQLPAVQRRSVGLALQVLGMLRQVRVLAVSPQSMVAQW